MSIQMLKRMVIAGVVCALFMPVLMVPTSRAQSADARAILSYDGLQEMKVKNLDMLFVHPDTTLAPYKKVWLDPVEVAYHKSWNPDRRSVNASDRERIRKQVAEMFHDIFKEELQKGGYEIATAAGPDVLRVNAAIINLYITAPDTMDAGRQRTYVVSPGEMTLFAELHDSESGAILARVADRRVARGVGTMQWATRASNTADARRALRTWAGVLRGGLDSARASQT